MLRTRKTVCLPPSLITTVISCGSSGAPAHKFCVGFEGSEVYCYGSNSGCKWPDAETPDDCATDADCSRKYTTSSPKFTNDDSPKCPDLAASPDWRLDACGTGMRSTSLCAVRACHRMHHTHDRTVCVSLAQPTRSAAMPTPPRRALLASARAQPLRLRRVLGRRASERTLPRTGTRAAPVTRRRTRLHCSAWTTRTSWAN